MGGDGSRKGIQTDKDQLVVVANRGHWKGQKEVYLNKKGTTVGEQK